jgi:hypothetical protein
MPQRCFFIMPFAPGFHYFYRYLKEHIEAHHDLECHRVDDVPHFTQAIIDKIKDEIRAADIIIADISGGNPNVFYELGLAHAHEKFTLLVTQDDYHKLPFDVESFRVLSYQNPDHFLAEIDQILIARFSPLYYQALYAQAVDLYQQMQVALVLDTTVVPREEFISTLQDLERRSLWSYAAVQDDDIRLADFLLSLIIEEYRVSAIRERITQWLVERYGGAEG